MSDQVGVQVRVRTRLRKYRGDPRPGDEPYEVVEREVLMPWSELPAEIQHEIDTEVNDDGDD